MSLLRGHSWVYVHRPNKVKGPLLGTNSSFVVDTFD